MNCYSYCTVEFLKWNYSVHEWFGPGITVSVNRLYNFPSAICQGIINPPGVNSYGTGIFPHLPAFFKAFYNLPEHFFIIPNKGFLLFLGYMCKTMNFFQMEFSIFYRRKYVPASGSAKINCQIIFCHKDLSPLF